MLSSENSTLSVTQHALAQEAHLTIWHGSVLICGGVCGQDEARRQVASNPRLSGIAVRRGFQIRVRDPWDITLKAGNLPNLPCGAKSAL